MLETSPIGRHLVIVDDDPLSGEILALLAAEAGFAVQTFDSGEAALHALESAPQLMLIDMQMPGVSGDSLARLIRSACGAQTVLLAMSATFVPAERRVCFDGFLLKPFSMEQVTEALAASQSDIAKAATDTGEVLNLVIFNALSQSMPRDQLRKLYAMCLDDADARIQKMRGASHAGDPEAYRRAAHSIKGGCGMVGATELAAIASGMEEAGPDPIGDKATFEQFLAASARLRRILDAP